MKFNQIKTLLLMLVTSIILSACAPITQSNADLSSWTLHDYLSPSLRGSTWGMMSERFQFEAEFQQPNVQQQIRWFKTNHHYLTEITQNAAPYLYYVYTQCIKRNMPPEIALLPMIESNYIPFAYSATGATGLWQLMPGTASGYGLTINWWYDSRRDLIASTNAALDYLTYLHNFFHNWLLAIAAYNAGEGTVQHAVWHNKKLNKPTDYWSLALPEETKIYVPKLLAIAAILAQPKHYGITISPVPYQPSFSVHLISGQYNLSVLAKMANISTETLRTYNPGFRRAITGPERNHQLLIPIANSATFNSNINKIHHYKVSWTHYKVKAGDNLSTIAQNFNTKVSVIKQVNQLTSDHLKINQSLLIPAINNKDLSFKKQSARIAEDHIPGPTKYIHTVNANDSLWSIAKLYHIKPRDLIYWNKLHSYRLKVGQKIIVWTQHWPAKHNYFVHRVKHGESLSTIAQHFSVNTRLIRLYNNMQTSMIKVGQKLKIPYHHHNHFQPHYANQLIIHYVNPGDSISSLAKYYRVSQSQLRQWNHLKKQQLLKLHQKITIYITS